MPTRNCSSPYIEDCSEKCINPSEFSLNFGNGICNDGINSDINFNCSTWNYDNGDCFKYPQYFLMPDAFDFPLPEIPYSFSSSMCGILGDPLRLNLDLTTYIPENEWGSWFTDYISNNPEYCIYDGTWIKNYSNICEIGERCCLAGHLNAAAIELVSDVSIKSTHSFTSVLPVGSVHTECLNVPILKLTL